METLQEHLKSNKFEKYYKKLKKKVKNKTIIIYGTGSMFQYILENYDLSELNIIGVCDGKYLDSQEGEEDLGYKIIPKSKLEEYEPDYLILGVQNYVSLLFDFSSGIYKDKKTVVLPLAKISLLKILKDIWCR